MSNSAGLADSAKRLRIKKKAVRPPVAGRPFQAPVESSTLGESSPAPLDSSVDSSPATFTPSPLTSEPSMVSPRPTSEGSRVTHELTPSESISTQPIQPQQVASSQNVVSVTKSTQKKKKAQAKKAGHTQPRFEGRLSGDHEKLVEEIQRKAFRESLAANKGINNSELFGGLLEAVRPFRKEIRFTSLDFKRGKLYGDGTERIKVEVGKSIQRSAFEYFLTAIESGSDELVGEVLSSLSEETRQRLASQMLTQTVSEGESEPLVANS